LTLKALTNTSAEKNGKKKQSITHDHLRYETVIYV